MKTNTIDWERWNSVKVQNKVIQYTSEIVDEMYWRWARTRKDYFNLSLENGTVLFQEFMRDKWPEIHTRLIEEQKKLLA